MDNHRTLIETIRIRYAGSVLLIIGIPFTGYQSFLNFRLARYPSAILLLSLCLTLLVFLLVLKIINRPQLEDTIYKLFFFVIMILLGAELAFLIGIEGELNRIPWFYIFPLLVFNIYSYKRGAVLTTCLLAIISMFWFLYPLSLDATQDILRNRFVQSVVLLTLVFFFAERQRFFQQEELILKQQTLTKSEKNLNDANDLLKVENKQRELVEKELLEYKDHLEQLVKDRTIELEETNQYLLLEIKEREQTEAQRLRLEDQLRQSQKMEAIGVLAGGIAHDFNNILGTMMGYSELLLSQFVDNSDEKNYVNEIYHAGERAADLVSQILTFSRAEESELKPMSFAPFLGEVISMARATLPSTIEILLNIHVDQSVTILANKTQVHQVIMNLCSNAAFAMRDCGGILEIDLAEAQDPQKRYRPPLTEAESYLELSIKDSGIGIPSETIERIFDPFFTTKRTGEGTGLGLSIVHGIVKSHSGKIVVESKEKMGTTFYLLFPVIKADEPEEKRPSYIKSQSGQHILVAEDETALARLYEVSLIASGYQVTIANNGAQALEKFRFNPDAFDLVFSDQIMPKMTGIELSREVRKLRPNIPIILATGYDTSLTENEAKLSNISHLLKKPVRMAILEQLIGEALAGNSG